MRKALAKALTYESEPLSRVELWLGIITVYLVLSAFFMGRFSAHIGAADEHTVAPVTNRA
ncbi:MAG TPA: hypothetical protein VIK60_07425 [Vicinamibacterales bacterium]